MRDLTGPFGCRPFDWEVAGAGVLSLALPTCLLVLLTATANAQPFRVHETPMASTAGRDVLVLATAPGIMRVDSNFGPLAAEAYDTSSSRVHIVRFDGRTYRASAPLRGAGSRIVFDPGRRRFVALLPSLRVELAGGVPLQAIAESLGAIRVTRFESLDFAVVHLPEELHPVDALARLNRLFEPVSASLRLQAPPIKWR